MLYQDTLTGMLHEIPDSQVYGLGYADDPYGVGEGQILYDGLGNPVGAWTDFLKKPMASIGGLVSKALPVVSAALGPAGPLIASAIPAIGQALAPAAATAVSPAVPQIPGIAPGMMPGNAQGLMPVSPGMPSPMPMPRPWPAGWIRPQVPYTGLGPRRVYMRCAVWPGPGGLVPAIAAQAPAAPAQAAAAAAAQTASALLHHRRRHYRR